MMCADIRANNIKLKDIGANDIKLKIKRIPRLNLGGGGCIK